MLCISDTSELGNVGGILSKKNYVHVTTGSCATAGEVSFQAF
jgi:hypothetical protein